MIGEITSGTIEKWNKGWNLFFSSFLNISYQEVIFTDIRMRMFFKSFPVLVIFSQILCRTTKPCKTKRRLIFPFSLPETRCSIPPTKVTNQPTSPLCPLLHGDNKLQPRMAGDSRVESSSVQETRKWKSSGWLR